MGQLSEVVGRQHIDEKGKVTLHPKDGRKSIKAWPVDANEILRQGNHTLGVPEKKEEKNAVTPAKTGDGAAQPAQTADPGQATSTDPPTEGDKSPEVTGDAEQKDGDEYAIPDSAPKRE